MKINKHYKLDKAVSTDEMRPILQKIYIDENVAVATDSKIMAIVPVELNEEDERKVMIDADVLTVARAYPPAEGAELNIELAEGKVILENRITMPQQLQLLKAEEMFPDYMSIMPKGDPKFSVAINIKDLNRLSNAFGCTKLILGVYGNDKPIRVIPMSETSKEIGLCMPFRNDDQLKAES